MFKKKNPIAKFLLKYRDRNKYKQYKFELMHYSEREALNFFLADERLDTPAKILAAAKKDGVINITHGGNAGDVIYALPTIKKIHESSGMRVCLYLRINLPMPDPVFSTKAHSMGKVMLNQRVADQLILLTSTQSYISKCAVYQDEKIHIDLDFFRTKTIPLSNVNSSRWYSYVTGFTPELWQQWLRVEPDARFKDKIILARSERYRNSTISYAFLQKYNNVLFIGVKSEYEDMKQAIPNLEMYDTSNFLEMAQIIAGCKFFIGNQSFPFSLAEALKVPRILEGYYHATLVIPEGEGAHDFYYQNHFEWLVEDLNDMHKADFK